MARSLGRRGSAGAQESRFKTEHSKTDSDVKIQSDGTFIPKRITLEYVIRIPVTWYQVLVQVLVYNTMCTSVRVLHMKPFFVRVPVIQHVRADSSYPYYYAASCLSESRVSLSRALQPRLAPRVERLGATTRMTLGLMRAEHCRQFRGSRRAIKPAELRISHPIGQLLLYPLANSMREAAGFI